MAAAALMVLSLLLPAAATAQKQRAEEVRYPSDPGTTLAGTLETPDAAAGVRWPAVVIVAGTGPWTRGGWIAIRARLQAAGIATLMFDKRDLGESTGTFDDTIPAMQRDVAAAVAFLRARPEIDPKRIVLMGISQGAVAAALAGAADSKLAGVVLLSGPVGPRGELFLEILRGHLGKARKSEAEAARVIEAVAAWMNARSTGETAETLARRKAAAEEAFVAVSFPAEQARGFVQTLDNDVVLSMFDVAPDRALASLAMPTLAIYGSRDDLIATLASFERATAALGGNRDALVVMVPGMTHELQRADPLPDTDPPPEDSTMPVVTDLVGHWLEKRLTRPRPEVP